MKSHLALLLTLLLPLGLPCAHAQQVRRCTGQDGRTIITDKPCAAINATDRLPPRPSDPAYLQRPRRATCAHTLDELSYEVASAIDLKDANRLAGVYHWAGMDGEQAYQVLARLEALVKRPLADIGPAGGGADAEPVWREDAEGNLVAAPPKRQAPTGLKIEQLLGRDGARTTQTVFGLRRYLGCLWISF